MNLTICVNAETKVLLQALAEHRGSSMSYIAENAIELFALVDQGEEFVKEIQGTMWEVGRANRSKVAEAKRVYREKQKTEAKVYEVSEEDEKRSSERLARAEERMTAAKAEKPQTRE